MIKQSRITKRRVRNNTQKEKVSKKEKGRALQPNLISHKTRKH